MGQETPAEAPPKKVYLGFGNFQFQMTEFAPAELKKFEYLGLVKAGLEKIEGVSRVEITEFNPTQTDLHIEKPEAIPRYVETGEPVPFIEDTSVTFDLHVPQSTQDELTDKKGVLAYNLGEDFRVQVRDGLGMSEAMVWGSGCLTQRDAWDAVAVAREILAAGFSEQAESPVSFEWFDRTPAFLTVDLAGGPEKQLEEFARESFQRIGYISHYKFRYHEDAFADERAAMDAFFSSVVWELDLMYRAHRANRQSARAWMRASKETQGILDAYQGTGLRDSLRRLSQGPRISRALIALARVELYQREDLQRLRTEFDSTYRSGTSGLLEAPVSEALNEFSAIPVEPLTNLLELFDSRRNTERGVAIATIASLFGAFVAAVATLIAAG